MNKVRVLSPDHPQVLTTKFMAILPYVRGPLELIVTTMWLGYLILRFLLELLHTSSLFGHFAYTLVLCLDTLSVLFNSSQVP
jgi:hypothetical protein